MADRVDEILKRWRTLQGNRGLWMHHWEDLARVELPGREGFTSTTLPGDRRTEDLYDGTALQAARRLANMLGGMLRPEGQPWFFIKTVEDEDQGDEADDWLADTEDRMRKAFDNPLARLRQATGETDLGLVVLGTAPLFVGQNVKDRRLLFQSVHLKDGIPLFGEDGNAEGMFRSRRMKLYQVRDRWGEERLSEQVRKRLDANKIDEEIEILFAVVPREDGRADALLARNLPFADLVIEVETKHEIAVAGFHEMPYVVPRWDTSSNEDFGRSPGMIALPDANTSQAVGETMLIAGQRAADPALLAPSDSFIDAPNTYPGGIAYYDADVVRDLGTNPIRPLDTGANFPLGREMQLDIREQIRTAFLLDRFNLPIPGEATMTATEVIARQEEFIRELGPVFGRLETDYTAPMVERAFNIMLRAGAFLPIPEALQGRSVRFEYESPVKRIRQQAQANAAKMWAQDLAAFEAIQPGAMDNVNMDAYAEMTGEALGVPHELMNGRDAVAEIRTNRQEQQELLQEAQLAAGAVDAGSKLLKALPEGAPGGGNA